MTRYHLIWFGFPLIAFFSISFVLVLAFTGDPVLEYAVAGMLIMLEFYVAYSSAFLRKKIVHLQRQSYLNGFRVWDWERNLSFVRLGKYIGHGLCYEASATMMLVLKGHFKTRFVYGKAHGDLDGRHCWIEVKAYGIWWTLDSAWIFPPCLPIPAFLHRLFLGVRVVRRITDEDFFSHEIATEMAGMVKGPKSSYIFHDLPCFRQAYWRNDTEDCNEMVIEGTEWWEPFCTEEKPGWNPFLIDIFKADGGRPVTQRIVRDFVAHDGRLLPKRRSFRKALTMEKTVNRCRKEATALHEKTGNTIEIEFTSRTTYELTELAPS